MSDGPVNFSKLSFFQKVEMAKENLASQGKSSPSTADIVKEMVNMEKAAKANGDALPEGYAIEHISGTEASCGPRRAGEVPSFFDAIQEVYGTPVINNNLTKIAQMLERITNDDTLSDEAKTEAIDILKEMVKLLTTGGEIPKALVDLIDNMSIVDPREVYGTPVIDPNPIILYGTPDIDQKTKDLANFMVKFMSSDVIPDDIKHKFMELLQNPEITGGAENSAQTMLMNALIELTKSEDVSEDVLKEIARLINELGGGNVVGIGDDPNVIVLLYGTPDIPNNPNLVKYMDFISRILSSDLPDEVKNAVKDLLNDPSQIGTGTSSVEELVMNTIRQLIENGNLSGDDLQKLIDIANSLGLENEIKLNDILGLGQVIAVYDTPVIDPIINNPNVKVVLDFLSKFQASKNIPDDLKAKMQELFKDSLAGLTEEDVIAAEVLIDAVNKFISENEVDQSILNEIQAILNSLDIDGADGIGIQNTICVYDTPDIINKRVLIVIGIIEKIQAEDSNIPPELKEELLQLLKDILHNLTDEDRFPDGIKEIIDNETITNTLNTKKALVSKDTNLEEKFPPDKFEIVGKVPMDSKNIMVIFRLK